MASKSIQNILTRHSKHGEHRTYRVDFEYEETGGFGTQHEAPTALHCIDPSKGEQSEKGNSHNNSRVNHLKLNPDSLPPRQLKSQNSR